MILNIGMTRREKEARQYEWKLMFAWKPIRIAESHHVWWLCKVWRKKSIGLYIEYLPLTATPADFSQVEHYLKVKTHIQFGGVQNVSDPVWKFVSPTKEQYYGIQ